MRGQRSNQSARMAGHIGHLCANRGAAKALVERVRKSQRAFDHGTIHEFGFPGKRQRVPGQIARRHGLFRASRTSLEACSRYS